MESIAKMMGHTNIRTTQGYAKVTDDKISEDMDRLMEKRRKKWWLIDKIYHFKFYNR